MKQQQKQALKNLATVVAILAAINFAGQYAFQRFDLTQDKRYTLSTTSRDILKQAGQPLEIEVFLSGNFPGEFKKLQTETRQLLEEFKAYNSEVRFTFTNPLEETSSGNTETKRALVYQLYKLGNRIHSPKEEAEIKASIKGVTDLDKAIVDSFQGNGMTPASVTVEDKGKQSQEIIFPWAIATYEGRSVKIPLLKNVMGTSTAEKVNGSVQHLEYAFSNAFNTVIRSKQRKIAVIKGNGEMQDLLMADFIKSVRENYFIGTFTLDSVAKKPQESLQYLKKYDLAIIVKPTEAFTDAEKQVLDQYIVNGGKSFWLMDQVNAEMDSLYNENGATLAFPRNLNLNDMFFKYGIRINPTLVKDVMAAPIALATGQQGSAAQYTQYPWFYAPLVYPTGKNPIVSNLDGVRLDFANGIDTLKNDIKKTVLLQSSPYSKAVGTPVEINLDMVTERPEQSEFKGQGNIPLAVLLEGKFKSVYQNRVLAFEDKNYRAQATKSNKMIVVSDGDIIKNALDKNYQPLELGYDKWTNKWYANKEFLLNCVNYLLDENGLINIRNKQVHLPVLDREKVYAQYTFAQVITVGVPLVLLGIFGLLFTWLRKRRYSR